MRLLVAFLGLFFGILAGLMVVIWNPSARIEPRFSLQTDEPTRLTILESVARGSGAEPRSLLGLGGTVLFLVPAMRAPGLVAAIIVLLLAFRTGNRILLGLALVFLLVYLSAYYYHLEISLLLKSVTLAGSGLVFLALRYAQARLATHKVM